MKEVSLEYKESTLAIDFDGVVHRYSRGFQGLQNAYDIPTPGTEESLIELQRRGFRLIIVSSRPTDVIEEWLIKYNLRHYFDEVTNIKQPAKYYIDDHAVYFDKEKDSPWEEVLKIVKGE